jgi:F420-dependent oxidoreductase-like protein
VTDALQLADLRIFTEPQQGASYDDLLAVARRAEELGFRAFFRSDHYLVMGDGDGLPGPTDAWVTLAGLARDTSTIRLGTLVSSATFRSPGPLAISVAQVDQMSGGRVDFGLCAGWFATEHEAYGIPFPELGERFDRLEEQLDIITGMWATPVGQTYSSPGGHYPVVNSPALPKPYSGAPPIVIGGGGPKRTPALAARFAAEFNTPFVNREFFTKQCVRVRAACETIDRDPTISSTPRRSSCAAAPTRPKSNDERPASDESRASCARTGSRAHRARSLNASVRGAMRAPTGSTCR